MQERRIGWTGLPRLGLEEGDRASGRDAHLFLTALTILLLSTLDAIFTLLLIDAGVVTEWNPIMAALIDQDLHLFARTKTALTAAGIVILVALVNRPLFPRLQSRIRVRHLLDGFLLLYLALVAYHFALVFTVILD